MSAGAAMASLVVAAYPERYAALALHSGLVHTAAATVPDALGVMQRGVPSPEPYATSAFEAMGDGRRVIPTLVIHGEADAVVVPINGSQAAQQWFLTNALTMGQPLDTTSGATDRSEREERGYLVRRSTYRAKDGTPLSQLVMVRELGHAWSGRVGGGNVHRPARPERVDDGRRVLRRGRATLGTPCPCPCPCLPRPRRAFPRRPIPFDGGGG